ncbi:HAD_2 domain-containing protein [Cephalotus follicularis]|uniref:HAD_2 domain-containing protein n=1 Tax=Cephalotus follicularis TaxID=3775 RepID=A0A1Q3CDI6_CEPFO|nr:HAD_2 domain-containing protein [Cephalotus follicularis]
MENEDQIQQASESKYQCLLFDLDDTLYPLSSGLSAEVTKNIQEYMLQKLGVEGSKVPELNHFLYKNYGTTMAGLKAFGYDFDPDDFHSFVHGRLPYDMLKPDPTLRSLLLSLPVRKVIFTNADKAHAARVLSRLGLEDCFEGIICFETLNPTASNKGSEALDDDDELGSTENFDINEDSCRPTADPELPKPVVVCKPFEEAFDKVFKIANIKPHKTFFFDDSIQNLQTGKRMGLHTVRVGASHRTEVVDCALESIHNIREALPALWVANESECLAKSGKVAIETSVEA